MTERTRDYRRALVGCIDSLHRCIEVIEEGVLQIALVVDKEGLLKGTVTDGDIRRGILRGSLVQSPLPRSLLGLPRTP